MATKRIPNPQARVRFLHPALAISEKGGDHVHWYWCSDLDHHPDHPLFLTQLAAAHSLSQSGRITQRESAVLTRQRL